MGGVADDVARTGVQYLIFTAWHWQANPLYPSEVHGKYRSTNVPERDLIGEIIDAITERGIQMILYTHPRDGHDFSPEDQITTGWSDGNVPRDDDPDLSVFNYELWNSYSMEMYAELIERYGSKISGIWFDGLGPYYNKDLMTVDGENSPVVDYEQIRTMLKAENPTAFMVQNDAGNKFNVDFSMWEGYSEYEQLISEGKSISTWPTRQMSMALRCFNHGWYVGTSVRGNDCTRMPVDEMIQFNLLQGSVSNSGGIAWATGPYCEGNVWGVNVLETLNTVGETLYRFEDSFINAKTSLSYPTISGDTLETKEFRFFMTSEDEKNEYLHILKMPENGTVIIESSQDGATLANPISMTESVTVESFTYDENGNATLVLSGTPDPVNTVIKFERNNTEPQIHVEWYNSNDPRIVYIGNGKKITKQFSAIWHQYRSQDQNGPQNTDQKYAAIEGDWTLTESSDCIASLTFEGSKVELYGATDTKYGTADIYIDGQLVASVDELGDAYKVRTLIFSSEEFEYGEHTIEVKTTKNRWFIIDAFKVTK